jgi:cytochrome c-type biogenesis protein CcmH/NrfG
VPPQLAPKAPAAAPPAAAAPRPAVSADEVEQRLLTLKRLRERGLISEEEFQQKRREILQSL